MVCLPTFPKLARRKPETNSHQGNPTYKYAAAEKKKTHLSFSALGKTEKGQINKNRPNRKKPTKSKKTPDPNEAQQNKPII